ncbi:MAG: hypothetical protein M3Z96_10550 [Pseudomonadota bacterium]|nr:hypothetical protein [Pseudomonadota bacterium]
MTGLNRRGPAGRRILEVIILEVIGFLRGGKQSGIMARRCLVGVARAAVTGAFAGDLRGDFARTAASF